MTEEAAAKRNLTATTATKLWQLLSTIEESAEQYRHGRHHHSPPQSLSTAWILMTGTVTNVATANG